MTRAIFTFLALAVAAPAAAQQRPTPEQIEAMKAKTLPGPQHRELAALEGEWTQEVTYTMGTPQPVKASGTVRNRMILGGRFLVSERVSKTPPGGPMGNFEMEAMTIYGFDGRTKEYTVIELDTTGTYWVSAAGKPAAGKGIVMSGESLDDHGGKPEIRRFDMVLNVIDADTYMTRIIFHFTGRPPATLVETINRRVK